MADLADAIMIAGTLWTGILALVCVGCVVLAAAGDKR